MEMIHSKYLKALIIVLFCIFSVCNTNAAYMLIAMDNTQSNHLKAYGIAYYAIENSIKVDWLLNYRGGSFMIKQHQEIENECNIRGVNYSIIADIQSTNILKGVSVQSGALGNEKFYVTEVGLYEVTTNLQVKGTRSDCGVRRLKALS